MLHVVVVVCALWINKFVFMFTYVQQVVQLLLTSTEVTQNVFPNNFYIRVVYIMQHVDVHIHTYNTIH